VDYFEVAAKNDGTILGIKLKLIQDLGAYHQLLTPAIPTLSVLMMPGLYRTQNVRADIIGAFTNCVPPTRIAAPAVPKPPTASSAWWIFWRPN
jgi:carbon-monoxide dehydrogenase large subunit